MARWDKEEAITELGRLIEQIADLEAKERMSSAHVRWIASVVNFLDLVFGPSSLYLLSFQQLRWQHSGSFVIQAYNIQSALENKHQKGYLRDLDSARGLLLAARDELERSDIEDVFKGKDSPGESSEIFKVLTLTERKLRKIMRSAPSKEREVQDAFENLLIGADIEHSREQVNLIYSSKTYIPDFVVPKLDLAIEIKLCARVEREKEVIAEVNDDILAYRQKFRNILFVIYDVGCIRDTDRFGGNFEENEGVLVRVVKH